MVHISQFYPCSRVDLSCEMYYICELGKYLFYNYKEQLSLDGVVFNKELEQSYLFDYFRLALHSGWIGQVVWETDLSVTEDNPLEADSRLIRNVLYTTQEVQFDREDNTKRKEDYLYNYCTPLKCQVSFKEQNDGYWLWTTSGFEGKFFSINNRSLCTSTTSKQNWLSLIAMVAVERFMTGSPNRLLLQFNAHICQMKEAISFIMILNDKSNCLKDWCYYNLDDSISENVVRQVAYTAWFIEGYERGYHRRFSTGKEKYVYCRENDIKIGDMVFLYEREMAQKADVVSVVKGCRLARVDDISVSGYKFTVINNIKTRQQGIEDWDNLTTAVKALFAGKKPYEKLNTSNENLDFTDCGVGHLLYCEKYFFIRLDDCDDSIQTAVDKGLSMELSQNDFVYWVLKDYNFDFNEERFLDMYFRRYDKIPMYTKYQEEKKKKGEEAK